MVMGKLVIELSAPLKSQDGNNKEVTSVLSITLFIMSFLNYS